MQPLKHKHKKILLPLIFFASGLLLTIIPLSAVADDTAPGTDETPAFSSPAQAQRAENLAAQSAAEPDEAAQNALKEANEKEAEQKAAQERYNTMVENHGQDSPEARQALAELKAAQEAYTAAQQTADEKMAEFAGVSAEEIETMRADGMGWGEIAHELGIHPGALGLGHTKGKLNRHQKAKMKGYTDEEIDELQSATARDLETGWSKGHGKKASDRSGGKSSSSEKGNRNKSDKGKEKKKKK